MKIRINPSFYDLDLGGVVNNIAYLRWMEDARTRLLEDSPLPLDRLMAMRVLPVVRHTSVDYHAPLFAGDRADLEVVLSELRRSGWGMRFRFVRVRDGRECVTAGQHGCFVDLDRLKPVAVPEAIRAYWTELFGPVAAGGPASRRLPTGDGKRAGDGPSS